MSCIEVVLVGGHAKAAALSADEAASDARHTSNTKVPYFCTFGLTLPTFLHYHKFPTSGNIDHSGDLL